jgi:hypothetical protein
LVYHENSFACASLYIHINSHRPLPKPSNKEFIPKS